MAVNLSKVGNAMFTNRQNWINVTSEEKEESFFIFNRYFSKTYPYLASKLNNTKYPDKVLCMDIWFRFMYDKPYPQEFWAKVSSKKEKGLCTEEEIQRIMANNEIDRETVMYLIENNTDVIKEELKYYKQLDKE